MTTRLSIYNGALRVLGEPRLASLTESRAARRELDAAWDDDFIDYCLEAGLWNFAMRTTKQEASTDITPDPDLGFSYAFVKPDDFIRTAAVCCDGRMTIPLLDYTDEAGYWFANTDTLYVSYVSNDTSYGADLSLWPETFKMFAQAHLAYQACMPITQSDGKQEKAFTIRKKMLADALSKDAMAQPSKTLPQGGWSRARMGGNGNRSRWNGQ